MSMFSRRQALRMTTTVVMAGGVSLLSACTSKPVRPRLDQAFFAELEIDKNTVRSLIEPLLASGAIPQDVQTLESLIVDGFTQRDQDLREGINARIAADFASGRTVKAGHWILAQTEARVWALYALL